MAEIGRDPVAAPPPVAPGAAFAGGDRLVPQLLRVAWLSIALGIALELVLLAFAATTGGFALKGLVADLTQKVSWSVIVCVGLALGTFASQARSEMMGLLGAISAPLGFTVARTVHKAVGQALGLGIVAGGASPFVIAGLKAIEYALLGALLGGLDRRQGGRTLTAHVVIGGLVGLVLGAGILGVMAKASPGPLTVAFFVPKAINELLFPLGCSLVIYAAEAARGRLTR